MAHNTTLGRAGEERAAAYLAEAGARVVDRNWRCPAGEIDIVALERGRLAIVEVKTRTSRRYGHPFEAIDDDKLARLWRLALAWARAHPDVARGRQLRVDAIAVTGPDAATATVEHLRGLA
ncbi:YraN family protein [Microbacterium excoecariae]|uniref:YraN family protein n=1 Tax=Microbacterium excoecariae TaxID=2715210 RepID=UPI001407DE12|nr:YraN family protein [Microbacterium excoecariae]NHI16826.1 YraN family protein [Microbacterium excoecariae]